MSRRSHRFLAINYQYFRGEKCLAQGHNSAHLVNDYMKYAYFSGNEDVVYSSMVFYGGHNSVRNNASF